MSRKVEQALKAVGAKLKRFRKHLVYELPNGKNVVIASTPSDFRAENNAVREIRKVAGVVKPEKAPPKPRRHKPGAPEREWSLPVRTPLESALSSAGIVEAKLRADIERLESNNTELLEAMAQRRITAEAAYASLLATRWVRLGLFLRLL